MNCKKIYIFVLLFVCVSVVFSDRLDEHFRALYSEEVKCKFDKSLNLDVSDIKVYFYDFTNHVNISCTIQTAVDCITKLKNLDMSKRLVIFDPGYKCNIKRDIEEWIRQTYKDIPSMYLIIIDHSSYTYETKEKLRSYARSVLYSFYIGKALGEFLAGLRRKGYPSKNIHCVGYSLGAHNMGYAGQSYFNETSEKTWRITGLDPAGPCFANSPVEEQLRSGNAEYVEIYHCSAGHLGTANIIGDIDFFFNKHGQIQPDCPEGLSDEALVKCYHKACVKYWTETVRNKNLYSAVACSSYEAFSEVNSPVEEQLRSGNAEYVEIYHCSAGHLGTANIIGDIDFFFNKHGQIQPDCPEGLSDEALVKCYHKACVKYWTETVRNKNLYSAVACSSYEAFSEGSCISNNGTIAGHSNPGNAKGKFYVSTASQSG